jgi:hypothetical protein
MWLINFDQLQPVACSVNGVNIQMITALVLELLQSVVPGTLKRYHAFDQHTVSLTCSYVNYSLAVPLSALSSEPKHLFYLSIPETPHCYCLNTGIHPGDSPCTDHGAGPSCHLDRRRGFYLYASLLAHVRVGIVMLSVVYVLLTMLLSAALN